MEPSADLSAEDRAAAQLAAVRDDPAGRLELRKQTYRGPTGEPDRQLPFRRAAFSFMRWQERRGILNPLDGDQPGSPWWREVNGRLLYDGCEAVARLEGRRSQPATPSVRLWLLFIGGPSASTWWQAHNASVVGAYLDHYALAVRENIAERFFMNVVLLRVLYAHALIGNKRLALGWFAPVGRLLGDPRLGMSGVFLSLERVLPKRYPLVEGDIAPYLAHEHEVGRIMDYAVIAPRLQALYEWSAESLGEPRLLDFIKDGNPTYAWPYERRDVWRPVRLSRPAQVLGRALQARE